MHTKRFNTLLKDGCNSTSTLNNHNSKEIIFWAILNLEKKIVKYLWTKKIILTFEQTSLFTNGSRIFFKTSETLPFGQLVLPHPDSIAYPSTNNYLKYTKDLIALNCVSKIQ